MVKPNIPKPSPELELLAKYKKALDDLTSSRKYLKAVCNFDRDENDVTYNKLVALLRSCDRILKRISPLAGVWVSNNRGAVIYNSNLIDDPDNNLVGASSSNSFKNYQERSIVYDRVFQTQATNMAQESDDSTVLQTEKACVTKFLNVIYVARKTERVITGLGQSSIDKTPMWFHV